MTNRVHLIDLFPIVVGLTISRGSGKVRPYCHGEVNGEEPERDQRNKVVELIGSVHHKTKHDNKEVHPEHHLRQGKKICESTQRLVL